jgi:hypothetical protein
MPAEPTVLTTDCPMDAPTRESDDATPYRGTDVIKMPVKPGF